ncbi:malate synthase [Bhargavaea massiliensis]|uniref:malate synthase n=1 Tax=Bhargavaea massiliensis TaxID=2697500 RepID=UPI001BCBE580|nr:malate synthase [Bhargavaea massiliensis]
MNLIDQKVKHRHFGTGNIVNMSDSRVEIAFGDENKRFIFPDVFGEHLVLKDQDAARSLSKIIKQKESERQARESKREKKREVQRKKHELRMEHENLMKNRKLHPQSQMVFWCDPEEQQQAFTEWKVFSGEIKSGKNKGKPNKPARLHQNSAVLLTVRDSGMPEQSRRIIGMYMVNEKFTGRLCEDGMIPAHSVHRIQLAEQESADMLFWNYYVNERSPGKMTWNTGKYRYFDNTMMAQILRDIVSSKSDAEEQEKAQQFFDHFCEMNQIAAGELPKPDGALMRK